VIGTTELRVADDVRVIKNVRIPMRDGCRLAADVYLPTGEDAPLPAVVDYIPYRKDEVNLGLFRHYLALVRARYAVVRIDIRGTGASEGRALDEYLPSEQLDGYDAVEWIAAQPWCDGHVNLMGISYGGFTALQVAVHQPPHLTSIIPIDATDDRYTDDCHYRGGLLRMYYDIGWYGTRMIAWNAMPPDPSTFGDRWAEVWREHLEQDEPYLLEWLRHQADGPYWRQGSVAGSLDRIVCPTFIIGGWRDGYPNPPLRLFEGIRGPTRVLVGPWDHAMPDGAIPGPRIDYLREVVRWLDHWCRGIDTGLMDEPPISVYVQQAGSLSPDRLETPGEWRSEAAWPPPGLREQTLLLGSGGRLVREEPLHGEQVSGSDAFEYDPTVGTTGGLWSGGVPFGLPGDQRADEARSLVYTTEPLDQPLTILGRARAVLHVSSSASVVGFVVSLADVDPDGASHLVAKGALNATRRASLVAPAPLIPDEVVELPIDVDATAWRFLPGHRIRLSIASADWPNLWPTPERATSRVWRGGAPASRLVLPVVPDQGSGPVPVFQPSAVDVKPAGAANPRPVWTITNDLLTGRAIARIETASRFSPLEGTGIERDFGTVCEVDPTDPAHAVARGWHRCRTTRDGHWTEARADVTIESNPSDFRVTIDLAVHVDGELHATRSWDETIPRAML
jgi:putative CocE/NonD family hydrolase